MVFSISMLMDCPHTVMIIVVHCTDWDSFSFFNEHFSHTLYIKFCGLYHHCMYKICEKISIYQYHNKWDPFLQQNFGSMELNIIDDIPYIAMND